MTEAKELEAAVIANERKRSKMKKQAQDWKENNLKLKIST